MPNDKGEHIVADMVLFALNTGDFYPKHCELAKTGAPHADWRTHVFLNVIPRYRRETHTPRATLTLAQAENAAMQLSDYYGQHVREMKT